MARKNVLTPLPPSAWNERTARHLLSRAGFGVPRARVAHLARLGPTAAVHEMVDYESGPGRATPPDFLPEFASYRTWREELKTLSADDRQREQQEFNTRERGHVFQLQAWWMERMVTTTRPLEEKMALFWHGHFATSALKVRESHANYALNAEFREHAVGNFKTLTTKVGQSQAMLRYLDNMQNLKGKPNENWARELMELFTMGVGNYTEHDIKESARAFTGWMSRNGSFVFNRRRHDTGTKTFLGRTGNFDGLDILDVIFEQPVTARFICTKLFEFFAYRDPEPDIIDALATNLRLNNYEVRPVLDTLFRSKAFYSDKAMGSQIKSPVQFLIRLADDLEIHDPPYSALARLSGELGQNLFYPPNVAGWEGGRAWINANTLLMRYNMPNILVAESLIDEGEASMMMGPGARQRQRREAHRAKFQSHLEALPRDQRRAVQAKLQGLPTREEKAAYIRDILFSGSVGEHWDLEALYAELKFETAEECADALAKRFLSVELSKDQRRKLAEGIGGGRARDTALTAEDLDSERMSAALHLVLSLAEYQLC